jgi:hypothetical protein
MHAIRLADNNSKALAIYKGTRKSALFDRKLKMYKVTASLKSMPEEIGRCRVFPAGWLENESIWLHMEYKYILEILRQGLHKEFYSDFKNVLIPFQKPERYGRSILENSSFIVSSAFIDTKLHGNGFVARLSGSTAELLEIWLIMNVGVNPFSLDEKNRLLLDFKPKLAGWLFDKKGSYGFNFLGNINVTYHNPTKKDTFGQNSAKIKKFVFSDPSGSVIETTPPIMAPYAEMIRDRQINKIDVYFK